MTYRPRGMPARYLKDAPEIVRQNVLDVLGQHVPAHDSRLRLYDVVFRPGLNPVEVVSAYFDASGWHGCPTPLNPHDMRKYRARNRRKRVAWADLPKVTQKALVAYLEAP